MAAAQAALRKKSRNESFVAWILHCFRGKSIHRAAGAFKHYLHPADSLNFVVQPIGRNLKNLVFLIFNEWKRSSTIKQRKYVERSFFVRGFIFEKIEFEVAAPRVRRLFRFDYLGNGASYEKNSFYIFSAVFSRGFEPTQFALEIFKSSSLFSRNIREKSASIDALCKGRPKKHSNRSLILRFPSSLRGISSKR